MVDQKSAWFVRAVILVAVITAVMRRLAGAEPRLAHAEAERASSRGGHRLGRQKDEARHLPAYKDFQSVTGKGVTAVLDDP